MIRMILAAAMTTAKWVAFAFVAAWAAHARRKASKTNRIGGK